MRSSAVTFKTKMADMEEDDEASTEEEGEGVNDLFGLEVYGQDYSPNSSDGEDFDENHRYQFDPTLPASHSYMGEGMEDVSGRTVHSDEDIVTLPLLSMQGIALVPGQILPLNLFHPQSVTMMKRVIDADKTFGLLHASALSSRPGTDNSHKVGTTAEIFCYKEDNEYGITTLMMKAEGRQRFRVLELQRQLDGVLLGKVKILPEVKLQVYPMDSLLLSAHRKPNIVTGKYSHIRYRANAVGWERGQRKFTRLTGPFKKQVLNCSMSTWPTWVYNLYNPYVLMDQLFREVNGWNPDLKLDRLSTEPAEFSHWMTANLPFDDEVRIELLAMNCPIQRLKKQLEIIKRCSVWCCTGCGNKFSDKANLFSMAIGGPVGAYVNPGGYIHETVTFHRASGLRLRGRPSREHSWFPGYAWTIAECGRCGLHIGWRFTSTERGLTPNKFWGLSRASLVPSLTSDSADTANPS